MPDKPPPRIGRYEVQSQLGTGGFGRVYKAYDPTVGRPVAIKILTDVDSPELAARFQAEAATTGNLHHANVVTIYDYGVHEGSAYIAMEYLEGQDLEQVIAAHQPLSLVEKVRIMVQVARALQHAHGHGVVHRDVKPSNIRLLPNGEAKVMDFGIARLVHSATERLTQTGLLIGTIRYISPEQLQGHDADALSDIFAYGVVFYELLSGENPFQAPNPAAVMAKITREQPAPLSQVAPGCPAALEQVVMRALEKDRELRFPSFAELLSDLGVVLRDLEAQRVAELIREAGDLVKSGRFAEAVPVVQVLWDLDPYNSEVRKVREQVNEHFRGMSVESRVEPFLKAARDQIARGLLHAAVTSLESALNTSPDSEEARDLLQQVRRSLQEQQAPRPAANPTGPATVLVDPKIVDLPPPAKSGAEPTGHFTNYIGKPAAPDPLRGYLTILSCPDSFREGQTIPVQSSTFTIGRTEGDLLISEDRTLSRRHASISWDGSGFSIRDLGSPNGTYLNGRRLPPNVDEPLLLNAEIRLSATTRLRFRCEISELPDFTGQKLADRYTLLKCLRAGRKSALYQAADSRPVRKVAVKLLSPTLATYPGYLEQFGREAQTAADLSHPNICKIYEHGCAPLRFGADETKSVNYLCMQMLDGGSLGARLDEPGHCTPAAVAHWLDIVCDALHDAHRNGVVHAGIKPTSIVFSTAGVPYVTDFAIAIRPQDAGRGQPILGAPEYLAPEQWDGQMAGPESDQYSLACLCYRVLTGVVPFDNQLDPDARSRNFQHGPVPAGVQATNQGRPSLPPGVSGVLSKAMSVRPGDRFPSTSDFAIAFRRSLGEVAVSKSKPRIFVSYRREADAGWAALFADKLSTQHGLDVFVDRHRVDSARQVPEKIESAIRECDFFVCLLARSTLKSAWVREEIRIADAAGKPMIPVVQEGFRRPSPSRVPAFLKRFVPRSWQFPESARRLMDAEEVRLFADYDLSAVERLAGMILSAPKNV